MEISSIWLILIFATNLSAGHTNEFMLYHRNGEEIRQYHVIKSTNDTWVMDDVREKEDDVHVADLNYTIEKKAVLHAGSNIEVSIAEICDPKKTDWKNTNEILMLSKPAKLGWTSILIKRTETGFTLSQETGPLENQKVEVQWMKKE